MQLNMKKLMKKNDFFSEPTSFFFILFIGFSPIGVLSEEDLEKLGRDDINLLYKSRQKIDPLEQIEQQFSTKTNY